MAEDGVGGAWEQAQGAGEVGVAEAGGDDLDEDFIGLDVVEVDLLELELAVELGNDEGGGGSRHCGCCGVI
jgi:hypothetical protein